ncbi:hypothetical protein [Actinophytocola glycyrrhizae]|uniref:Uncharacterized protein n=1 Tax=Actinophytocola glycyrrhizae TaxID=2044873 RepID=A0ABV9S4K1_9PSEU
MGTLVLDLPDTVWRLPLDHPRLAIQEYAGIVGELRGLPTGRADLEALATETVETAVREGAVLMAVVAPPGAAPAVLTGVVLDLPPGWDPDTAAALRDAVEDVGGPDVRETLVLGTALGPAVIAQRVPGVEQARAGRPLTLQLQAFIAEGEHLLLLTLACPATHGWATHQLLFGQVVASARAEKGAVAAEVPEDSYENHTYRL